jgi:glycosyltransferase involved in cell wall biosynthesis
MYLISVVIITYNEERNIGRCLDSVQSIADEIIVLDSFSTDNTVAIAKEKGAIVKQSVFSGYARQKNLAVSLAANNYVLSLDADEALDEKLTDAIRSAKMGSPVDMYSMNRCTNYCGKFIRHGSWYPDKKIRLFNKTLARWGGYDLHEKIEFETTDTIVHLKGDLFHYSFSSIEEHMKKSDKYSTIAANALYAKGKKTNWIKLVLNPFWSFVQGYIIRLGFLDGRYGFAIAINNAHATFLKYIKLYTLQQAAGSRSYPAPDSHPADTKNIKNEQAV